MVEIDITDNPDIQVAFEVWKDIAVTRSEEDIAGIHLKGVYSEVLVELVQNLVRSGKAKSVTQYTIKGLHGKTAFVSSVVRPVSTGVAKVDKKSVPGVRLAITPEVTQNRLALNVKGKVTSCTTAHTR